MWPAPNTSFYQTPWQLKKIRSPAQRVSFRQTKWQLKKMWPAQCMEFHQTKWNWRNNVTRSMYAIYYFIKRLGNWRKKDHQHNVWKSTRQSGTEEDKMWLAQCMSFHQTKWNWRNTVTRSMYVIPSDTVATEKNVTRSMYVIPSDKVELKKKWPAQCMEFHQTKWN